MKDKRKILLGTKDVYPQVNKDLYINLEISNSADELQKEIINNDFNLREQLNKERRQSLKFCLYGTFDSMYSDLDNLELSIKTNHEDLMYVPRIESGANASLKQVVVTKNLSFESGLSKNMFKKNKSSFCFMFELSPGIKNYGDTKALILSINNSKRKVYSILEIPFLFFDSDKNLVEFGTDTVDIDLNGNEQVISNDYPFLYDTHWIKKEFKIPRPLRISFSRTEESDVNNLTVNETGGVVNFVVSLDYPSLYGIEEAEVFIQETDAVNNPNKDFNFNPQKISWEKGEQYKNVSIELIDDLYAESDEKLIFGLRDVKYADKSKNKTFELIIQNDDIPSPIGFASTTGEMVSSDGVFKTIITTSNAIKVPSQSIDLVLDDENSDIIIGEDIENTGTFEKPEYRKTINLKQGLDIFEVEINIKDNFKYDFEKIAIFKLENPTQNISIPDNLKQLDLTIKDSMVVRYTNYRLDSSKIKGQGMFRLKSPTPENPENPVSFITTSTGDPEYSQNIVTSNFRSTINIINDGEPVIFGDKLISSGETLASIDFKNGYIPLNVTLPSNTSLDKENMCFKKSKYKFVISDISSSSFTAQPNDFANTYSDVTINPQELKSSFEKSGKTHYLTSTLSGVRTRMRIPEGGPAINLEAYNLIISENISVEDSDFEIVEKLKLSGQFDVPNSNNSGQAQYDLTKITIMKAAIRSYMSQNPNLEPPQPYVARNSVQKYIIKGKINGILILNKILTEDSVTIEPGLTSNIQALTSLPSVIFNSIFGSNSNTDGGPTRKETQVSNVKFEEEPVTYSLVEPSNKFNSAVMPIEPFL